MDAMAAAVENAHCILICITERYKASANCRLEGTCESWGAGACCAPCARACAGRGLLGWGLCLVL